MSSFKKNIEEKLTQLKPKFDLGAVLIENPSVTVSPVRVRFNSLFIFWKTSIFGRFQQPRFSFPEQEVLTRLSPRTVTIFNL